MGKRLTRKRRQTVGSWIIARSIASWNGQDLDVGATWAMMCQPDYVAVDTLIDMGKTDIVGICQGKPVRRLIDWPDFNEMMKFYRTEAARETKLLLKLL